MLILTTSPSSVITADHRGGAFGRMPACRGGASTDVPVGRNQAGPLHV